MKLFESTCNLSCSFLFLFSIDKTNFSLHILEDASSGLQKAISRRNKVFTVFFSNFNFVSILIAQTAFLRSQNKIFWRKNRKAFREISKHFFIFSEICHQIIRHFLNK